MSTGRSAAKRAAKDAEASAAESKQARLTAEAKLMKERQKAARMFVRQSRARSGAGGGFFDYSQSSTLG